MWKRLTQIKDRLDPVLVAITFLVSLASTGLAAIVYVNTYVKTSIDEAIGERIHPYQQYLSANHYFVNEDADRCLDILIPLLGEIDAGRHAQVPKDPIYDLTIACARDSSAPARHASLIRRIERKLESGEILNAGWHSGSLGWYYLRFGEVNRARSHFGRAIGLFSADGNLIEEAESHFGMALVHLIDGDPTRAALEYRRAGVLNPQRYRLSLLEAPVISRLNERNLSNVRNNGSLQSNMTEFVRQLRSLSSADSGAS